MDQGNKKKGRSNVGTIIFIIIAAMQLFGNGVSGLLLLPIAVIGVIIFLLSKKARAEAQQTEDLPSQRWQQPNGQQRPPLAASPDNRRPAVSNARGGPSSENTERNSRRVELQELLEAGIIEKDEYNDRISALDYERY